MTTRQPYLSARLQGFGTTIFTEMTRLAIEHDALNLGQGSGRGPRADGRHIRTAAGERGIPLLTTAAAGLAAANGMADWRAHELEVRSLQDYHAGRSDDQLALEV